MCPRYPCSWPAQPGFWAGIASSFTETVSAGDSYVMFKRGTVAPSPAPLLNVPHACMPCLHAAWALSSLLTGFFPLSRQAAELNVRVWAAHRKLIGPHGGWACIAKDATQSL